MRSQVRVLYRPVVQIEPDPILRIPIWFDGAAVTKVEDVSLYTFSSYLEAVAMRKKAIPKYP